MKKCNTKSQNPKKRTKRRKHKKNVSFRELRQHHAAMASNVMTCFSKSKYLTDYLLVRFLSALLDVDAVLFLFGLLLTATGLHPSRMSQLRCTRKDLFDDGDVYLDLQTGILSYDVQNNGNWKNKSSKGPDRVGLQLPKFLCRKLRRLEQDKEGRLFANIMGRFNYQARKFRDKHGGVTPTPVRMARTFEAFVMPHMKDNLVALTLTGRVKSGYSAQSHYYQFCNRELNRRWKKAFFKFIKLIRRQECASMELHNFLSDVVFDGCGPKATIGPRDVVKREALDQLEKAIRSKARTAREVAENSLGIEQLMNYVRLINLLGVYLFLLMRFSYALRPVADRCQIHTGDLLDFSVIEDKDSDWNESRMTPRVKAEQKQQAINRLSLALLLWLAKRFGVKVECQDGLLERGFAVHAEVRMTTRGKARLILKPFTQQRFNEVLVLEGIENPCPDNENRIYLATHMRGKLHQALVDQLLNHNRGNHDVFAPYSTASVTHKDFDLLRDKLGEIYPIKTLNLPLRDIPVDKSFHADINKWLRKADRKPRPKSRIRKKSRRARPATHPPQHTNVQYLPHLLKTFNHLMKKGLEDQPSHSLTHAVVALALSLEYGVDKAFLLTVMSKARWKDLDDKFRLFTIPFDREVKSPPCFTLPLIKFVALMLKGLYKTLNPSREDYVFSPRVDKPSLRKVAVERRLEDEWKVVKAMMRKADWECRLPNLKVALSVGKLYSVLESGMQPFHCMIHSDATIPTTHGEFEQNPHTYDKLNRAGERLRWIDNVIQSSQEGELRVKRLSTKMDGSSFFVEAKKIMRKLRKGVKFIYEKQEDGKPKSIQSIKTQNDVSRIHALVDDLLVDADALAPDEESVVHLALLWLRQRCCVDGDKNELEKSSINTYLSNVFAARRLLSLKQAENLPEVDPGMLLAKMNQWLNKDIDNENTREQVFNRYREVLVFGHKQGFFPELILPSIDVYEHSGTPRNDIIDPFMLDVLLNSLMASDVYQDREQALMILLAHYAGMRESEIRRLKLDDVVTTPSQCWIYIRCGKSDRARRVIALHHFTKRDHIEFIHACWGLRFNRHHEFVKPGSILTEIFLLGPEYSACGHSRDTLTNIVIESLKREFGRRVDLHLLRHGFASWLVLRVMALRNPNITEDMPIQNHWLFRKSCQYSLKQWLTLGTGELTHLTFDSLLRVASVIGHSGIETLFGYYVQTFVHIQVLAVMMSDNRFEGRLISRKTTQVVFPRMSSSATLALHGRTVGDLFESVQVIRH